MGKITLNLTDQAEELLRTHNKRRGDMRNYLSILIINDNNKGANE